MNNNNNTMPIVAASHSAAKNLGLDQVNVAFLKDDYGQKQPLPLVITPRWDDSLGFLKAFCEQNRSWLDDQMLLYGAVLFRGFAIEDCSQLEQAIKAYQPNLHNTYRGTSPRRMMSGTEYVFSAAEVPVNYPIAQHIEMSFLPAPPRQLFFGCMKPSASAGGETALCHFGKVYEELPTDLRCKFLAKGIRYERRHKKVGSYYTYDVSDMVGWPELFGTSDKKKVEELCAAEGVQCAWEGPEGNETFVCVTCADACQLHPTSGKPIWFNHTQVFHWTTFPMELWFSFCRTRDWRLLIHCLFVTIFCVVKYGMLRHKMSLHCRFGDDTDISVQEMNAVRNAIHKNMIFFRWAKADLLMIDNLSTSHGRQPTYDSGRKIVVSWAEPWTKHNMLRGAATDDVNNIETMIQKEDVEEEPGLLCMENPQERTPQSTLTKESAKELQKAMIQKERHSSWAKEANKILEGVMHDHHRQEQHEWHSSHKRSQSQPTTSSSFTESSFWKKLD